MPLGHTYPGGGGGRREQKGSRYYEEKLEGEGESPTKDKIITSWGWLREIATPRQQFSN